MSLDFYLDVVTGKRLQSPSYAVPATDTPSGKLMSETQVRIQYLSVSGQKGTPVAAPSDALKFGLKPGTVALGQYAATTFDVYTDAFTAPDDPTLATAFYTATLAIDSTALRALFPVDGNGNSPGSVGLIGEILSGEEPSDTFAFNAQNNLIKGTESPEVATPGASGYPAPSAVAQKLVPTAVKTAAYTAVPRDFIPVDATSASVALTLPAAPADGSQVGVKLIAVSGAYVATITRGGSTDVFNNGGGPTSLTLSLLNQGVLLQYDAALALWYVLAEDVPLADIGTTLGTVAAGDDSRLYVITPESYGAKGDGVTDDHPAIQAALNASPVGGVVQLAAKGYYAGAAITVPPFVSLRGVTTMAQRVIATDVGQTVQSLTAGSRIIVGFGAGGADSDTAAVSLQADAAIEDLSFYWPGQPSNASTPTTFPPAIRATDYGFRIAGIEFINAWMGVDCLNAGRGTIRDCYGDFLHIGIRFDACYDIIDVENITFSCLFFGQTTALAVYRLNNATAFDCGRIDGLRLSNCFVFKYKYGIHTRLTTVAGATGAAGAVCVNCAFDTCGYAIYNEVTQAVGWQVTNMVASGCVGGGYYSTGEGHFTFINASFTGVFAGTYAQVTVKGDGNSLTMIGCTLECGTHAGLLLDSTAASVSVVLLGNSTLPGQGGTGYRCETQTGYGVCRDNLISGQAGTMYFDPVLAPAAINTLVTDNYQSALTLYKSNSGGVGGELTLGNNGTNAQNATAVTFTDGSVRGRHAVTSDGANNAGVHRFYSGQGSLTEIASLWPDGGFFLGTGATASPGANTFSANGTPVGGGTFPFAGIPYSPSPGGTPTQATGAEVSALVTGAINPSSVNATSGTISYFTASGYSNLYNTVVILYSYGVGTAITPNSAGTGLALTNATGGAPANLALGNLTASGTVTPGSFTVSTVPSAASYPGGEISVTNAAAGAGYYRSDGTVWRRVGDANTVLS